MNRPVSSEPSNALMLHAAKWATASNILSEVTSVAVTFLLAALLQPAQFGLVALSYISIVFLEMIVGFGLNAALIQKKSLAKECISSVFWLNLAMGIFMASLAVCFSGPWSRVNGQIDLKNITIVLSFVIPVQAASLVQTALLQKEMNFKALAIRNNSAGFLSGMTGVAFAILGYGAWALVFQHITREVISAFLLWRFSSWRPSFVISIAEVRNVLPFAFKAFCGQIGVFAQNQLDSILVGFLFGPSALGVYRLADRLVEMILRLLPRAMQAVSLPHFSKLQNDIPELNKCFLMGSHICASLTFPFFGFLAGTSPVLMKIIGMQWDSAAALISILTIIGMAKAILVFVGPMLQALGKPGIHTFNTWVLVLFNGGAVMLVALMDNLARYIPPISALAIIRSTLFICIFTPLLLYQVHKNTYLRLQCLYNNISKPLYIAGAIYLINIAIINLSTTFATNKYIVFLVCIAASLLLWLGGTRRYDPALWSQVYVFLIKALQLGRLKTFFVCR